MRHLDASLSTSRIEEWKGGGGGVVALMAGVTGSKIAACEAVCKKYKHNSCILYRQTRDSFLRVAPI